MWNEIMVILMALVGLIFNAEVEGNNSEAKQKMVINDIVKEIEDPGGIEVKNKYVLVGIKFALPYMVKFIVYQFNRLGVFTKSS